MLDGKEFEDLQKWFHDTSTDNPTKRISADALPENKTLYLLNLRCRRYSTCKTFLAQIYEKAKRVHCKACNEARREKKSSATTTPIPPQKRKDIVTTTQPMRKKTKTKCMATAEAATQTSSPVSVSNGQQTEKISLLVECQNFHRCQNRVEIESTNKTQPTCLQCNKKAQKEETSTTQATSKISVKEMKDALREAGQYTHTIVEKSKLIEKYNTFMANKNTKKNTNTRNPADKSTKPAKMPKDGVKNFFVTPFSIKATARARRWSAVQVSRAEFGLHMVDSCTPCLYVCLSACLSVCLCACLPVCWYLSTCLTGSVCVLSVHRRHEYLHFCLPSYLSGARLFVSRHRKNNPHHHQHIPQCYISRSTHLYPCTSAEHSRIVAGCITYAYFRRDQSCKENSEIVIASG